MTLIEVDKNGLIWIYEEVQFAHRKGWIWVCKNPSHARD